MSTSSYSALLLLLSVLLAGCGSADLHNEPRLILPQGAEALVNARPYTQVWLDESAALPIEVVVQQVEDFEPVQSRYIDFGLTEARVWLRIVLVNPEPTLQVWRLDLGRQYMEWIAAYQVEPGRNPQQLFSSSVAASFSERMIPRRSMMADMQLTPGQPVQIFIGYTSASTTFLPVTVGRPAGVVAARGGERMLDMFLNGALVAMLVIVLLMSRVIGMQLALCFAAYILAGTLYVAHADGYTVKYLWPNTAQLNDAFNMAFMLLMTAAAMNFARVMFNFKQVWPAYGRFLLACSLVALGVSVLAILLPNNYWLMVTGYPITPICSLIQVTTGVLAFRRGYAGALPYLLGALGVASSFIYAFLAHMLPGQMNLDTTLDYGHLVLLFECFAFGAAIAARLLKVSWERDQAQQAELRAVQDRLAMSDTLRQTQQQYLDARQLSTERHQRLSAVSHDMRQPLGMLRRGFEQLAVTDESEAESLHNALDYLEQLATDQIQGQPEAAGQTDGQLEVFPLAVVLQSVQEMFQAEAQAKGLQLNLNASSARVCADPIAVMRVLSNLVHNAICHTGSGSVDITTADTGDSLQVLVVDTGPGMSATEQEKMRERYEKGSGSSGHGLGLSIVEELSARYDLNFQMSSTPGSGTQASIVLPVA